MFHYGGQDFFFKQQKHLHWPSYKYPILYRSGKIPSVLTEAVNPLLSLSSIKLHQMTARNTQSQLTVSTKQTAAAARGLIDLSKTIPKA